jgi:penicillin G amidase
MQNVVAADTQGRTAYQAVGKVPLRNPQDDIRGIAPAPGWEAKYDWNGWLRAADVPRADHAAITAKGWHATANQRIHAADYPHFMGSDWHTPERFDRIETLLGASPKHTAQTMRDIQADTFSIATQRLLPVLRATASGHPQAAAAKEQLLAFKGDMKADSSAALVFAYWADELTRGLLVPKLGEERFKALYGKRSFREGLQTILFDPRAASFWCGAQGCSEASSQALTRALERIVKEQGKDVAGWRWGKAHLALSGHRPFGNVPLLAKAFDVTVPSPGDNWTINVGQYWASQAKLPFANRHAASLRAVYDLADLEKSQFIYQTGQSGLVFSGRYRDMSEQWARVEYRALQMQPKEWRHEVRLVP